MIDMLTSVHLSYFYSLYSTHTRWDLHSDLIHDPHTGFGGATVVEGVCICSRKNPLKEAKKKYHEE